MSKQVCVCGALIPPEVLYVSESGIRGAEDVAVLYKKWNGRGADWRNADEKLR